MGAAAAAGAPIAAHSLILRPATAANTSDSKKQLYRSFWFGDLPAHDISGLENLLLPEANCGSVTSADLFGELDLEEPTVAGK